MNRTDLLTEFRKSRAEEPFRELVCRYTNLVFSVAKRRLSNPSLAEEITQIVFIRLAKAAPDLRGDAQLVAWLHRTTVHASIDLWRSETRRRAREEHAVIMQPEQTGTTTWDEIAPLLDEALDELNESERQVILLRYFERKSMRELGLVLEISEDAAKMRVSRAIEHLRDLFCRRGVACGTAALGAVLMERAAEAAPVGLAVLLAKLRVPSVAALGLGFGVRGLLAQLSKPKLVALVAGTLTIGAATTFWLRSAATSTRVLSAKASQPASAGAIHDEARLWDGGTNAVASATAPDPLKLLKAVARARNRIASGEMELDLVNYGGTRELEGTNLTRLKVQFDGTNRRFESFNRQYSYTSTAPDASEVTDARIKSEGLGREAAVRAGLLKGFESHHVTAYDGARILDYRESDGKSESADVVDPKKGSGSYVFDPRCLGISTSMFAQETIESCLACDNGASVQLVGEELVAGISTWHIRLLRWGRPADFWLEKAHPIRVVKHAYNGSDVVSAFDGSNYRDPIPLEIITTGLHGTTGRGTAVYQKQIIRRQARFDIPVNPDAWTLAGLGMKIGTAVADNRIMRRIGYWDGIGLSDNLPARGRTPQIAPNLTEMINLLDSEPSSPAALEAAQWIILNTPDGPDVDKAAQVILQEHIRDTNLVRLSRELERLRPGCSRKLLEALVEKNPSIEVQGNACLSLADLRNDEAKHGQNQQATAEAKKLFERVIADFGRTKRNGTPLAEIARPILADLRRMTIGQAAPDIQGEDLDGRSMTLRDYRGKVVLLVFWGECGGCRPDVQALLKLLERLKGKPFAIVGVYGDDDWTKAPKIVEELGMTWPSFRDGRTGAISTAWNNHSWPNLNLIDAKGNIRYRDVRELKVSEVVESLLKESVKFP